MAQEMQTNAPTTPPPGAAEALDPGRAAPSVARGPSAPDLSFERTTPTLQQEEEMLEGLHILARWLLRRYSRAHAEAAEKGAENGP